jgi:hypothetical protein
MNPESENFDQLRRLLALKRHEQPPPGYFDRFSRQVIVRIKAGEQGDEAPNTWLQRFWAVIEAKPVFAGAFGAAVCGVLISGILNSEEAGVASASSLGFVPGHTSMPFAGPAPIAALSEVTVSNTDSNNSMASLNAMFDVPVMAQPASWSVPGGN